MSKPLHLHADRLLPADPTTRTIARQLYGTVKDLPIISPHGHTDPRWFADNDNFDNAADLLVKPDHYVFRMLYSLGVSLEDLGLTPINKGSTTTDPRAVWRLLAEYYYAFKGTPSRLWLDYVFNQVFNIDIALDSSTADYYFDHINDCLASDAFRPRALFDRFNIELLATTESPLDSLQYHEDIRRSDWRGRVITTFRPDPVLDPEYEGFHQNLQSLAELTGEATDSWAGYLKALRKRREEFKASGATATDHGHPTARSADLDPTECEKLFNQVRNGQADPQTAELFRAQMLTEMARMSVDDGLVMQLHPGSFRNHNRPLFEDFGRDKGADIPVQTEFVNALQPLLNRFGNDPKFSLIVFTLDESSYSRELAPLAGHYPALKLGPAWWFHDSPEGMKRFRQQTTETAGFYNTVGFNDDTRAFLSIPARHDVARRMDCAYLAELVADHRLDEEEAAAIAQDLSYNLAKSAYRL